MSQLPALAAAVSILLTATAAAAACPARTTPKQNDANARREFEAAVQLEPADPKAALERLRCAERLYAGPAISLRMGIVLERLGRKADAAQAFERYLLLAGDSAPDRPDMERRIKLLREQTKADSTPQTAPGTTPAAAPEPTRDSSPGQTQRTVGWIGVGTGAVLLAAGGWLLLSAKRKSDDVHDISAASNTQWESDDASGRFDSAKREQTFGIVALAVGAVVAGGGSYLVVSAPGPRGSTGLSLGGRF